MGTKSKPTADDAAPSVDDVIETFWCDVRQLQILMRVEQAKLVLPRPEYVSQKANHLRDNFVVASKVFDQWHTRFAKLHPDPIKFFGVTATSYGAMIRELTFRSFKILESLRLGFAKPQYSIVTTSFSPYSFSLNDVKKLRRWFDTQEPFHFSGLPDEQVSQIHQRFGELLVGFRQECAQVEPLKLDQQSTAAATDHKSEARIVAAIANLLQKPKRTKRKAKRPAHRPQDTDANQDAKIADKWNAWRAKGNPRSIVLFVQDFGYDEGKTRDALERVRSRRKKSVKRI